MGYNIWLATYYLAKDLEASVMVTWPFAQTQAAKKPCHPTIGALIIRIGLWGPLYFGYNKEPPTDIV